MKLLFFILLIASVSVVLAEEYQGHGVSFQIPEGWYVAQNNTTGTANDTKIVLTNEISAIRIDMVSLPHLSWLRSMSDDICANGVINNYYINKVLKLGCGAVEMGSSAQNPNPDNIKHMSYWVGKSGNEWTMAWAKPEYGERFIGIHAIFDDKDIAPDKSVGSDEWHYNMPRAFYEMLESMRVDLK